MAYICYKENKCEDCKHFRWDDEREDMVCYAKQDKEKEYMIEAIREALANRNREV